MALINLRGYFYTELGVGVGGIEVNCYAKLTDGTWGGTVLATTTSASGSGKWEFINLDTALSTQTGIFAIRFRNPSTNQQRKRDGDEAFQTGNLVGASGAAPFPDGSVTGPKILDGAVTDAKLGNRTADPTLGSPASTGTLTQLLGWITGRIKAISGTTNWYDAPATTIAALNTAVAALVAQAVTFTAHLSNTNNPHSVTHSQIGTIVAADLGAGAATDTVIGTRTIVDTTTANTDTGTLTALVSMLGNMIKAITGGATWRTAPSTTLAIAGTHIANTSNPHNVTATQAGVLAFKNVVVGASTIVADSAADTLTLTAGSNITLTPNTSTDSVTISASSGSGDADTLRGNDGDLYPFLKAISAISGSAPSITTGPWRIQAGRYSVSSGRSAGAFSLPLAGTINGYVTAILIPEKSYDTSGAPGSIELQLSTYTTGASPSITGDSELLITDSIDSFNSAFKINYFVIHW